MPYLDNQRKIHYTDSRDPASSAESASKGTIVFIHGLGSSQNYWLPVLPSLSDYRTIIYDAYGAARSPLNGDSELKSARPATLEFAVQDVSAICESLVDKHEKVWVVGHSMGGMVACAFAATHPQRVEGVVAVGPVHPGPEVATVFDGRIKVVEKGMSSVAGPALIRALTVADGMEPLANTIPYAATGSKSTALHHAFIRELLLSQTPAGYIANCKIIATATPPSYGDITVPFLLIEGAEDKSAPRERCQIIWEGVKSDWKERLVLQGVGHWHAIEAGKEVGDFIATSIETFKSQ